MFNGHFVFYDNTYLFNKGCLFLYVQTPFYNAQVLKKFSIGKDLLIHIQKRSVDLTCLRTSKICVSSFFFFLPLNALGNGGGVRYA